MMEAAELIARVLGPLYVIVAGGLLVRPEAYIRAVEDFMDRPGVVYLAGFLALIFGLVILAFHHGMGDALAIVITVIGVIAVFKGAVLIICPEPLLRMSNHLLKREARLRLMGGVALLLGLYLTVAGYAGS